MSRVRHFREPKKESGCFIYEGWKNYTSNTDVTKLGYEGIPQHLLINVGGTVIIIAIFSLIRKKAWNYGRLAFKQQVDDHRDRLYGGTSTNLENVRRGRSRNRSLTVSKVPVEIFVDDRGLFSWLFTTLHLTDEQIQAKSGTDAIYYLSFQRHLIFIGFIIMIVSIVIVLPCNFQGDDDSTIEEFDSARIQNLGNSGNFVWVHISLTMLYVFLTVIVLRHFAKSLASNQKDPVISRTVMISRIAKRNSHTEKLKAHFHEIYPDIEIEEVSFAYNITKLQYAESAKTVAASAKAFWEHYLQTKGVRPTMRPYTCGKLLCCCEKCGCKKVDAIEYYSKEEELQHKFVELERKKALSKPLGIAFTTFKTFEMAHRVVTDYHFLGRCFKAKPYSTFSRKLKSNHWNVKYAPLPEDLYWENLNLSYKAWYLKALIVNGVLIVVVIIYSTPVIVLNVISQQLSSTKNESIPLDRSDDNPHPMPEKETVGEAGVLEGIVRFTVPTVLLWITAITLPGLVSVSDECMGFWTKTAENRSRMLKTYLFLLFQVIILPSLGAQSIQSFFDNSSVKLECIFTRKNNVFFVNYMITSALLGATSELLRLDQLLCYALKLYFAKSAAEVDSVRKAVLWDFQFGAQYAWTMLNFTMFVMFNLISPIITPFGLLYLIMKHYVDRYNIYFAYAAATVEKEVHITAINFALASMFLLQIIMLSYTTFTANNTLKVVTVLFFCITTAFFIGQVFFNMCTNFSPVTYQKSVPKAGGSRGLDDHVPSIGSASGTHDDDREDLDFERSPESGGSGFDIDVTNAMQSGSPLHHHMSNDISDAFRRKLMDGETIGRYYPRILRREGSAEGPSGVVASRAQGHEHPSNFAPSFASTVAPSMGSSRNVFADSQPVSATVLRIEAVHMDPENSYRTKLSVKNLTADPEAGPSTSK